MAACSSAAGRQSMLHTAPCPGARVALPSRPMLPRLHTPLASPASLRRASTPQPASSRARASMVRVAASAAQPAGLEAAPVAVLPAPASTWDLQLQRLVRSAAAVALGVALAFTAPGSAEAARSGGRVGGRAFGAGGRSGTGFGSGAGAAFKSGSGGSSTFGSTFAGSGSRSGHSSSYGSGSTLGGGFASSRTGALAGTMGYRSTPPISMNSFFLSPFGFGYGYGVGFPLMGGGGGVLSILFWGVFAVLMIQVLQGLLGGGGGSGGYEDYDDYDEVVTVAKVQVGLLANARELQRDLERIAARADSESPEGLHYILQETVLALMRNPDYCQYGFAKSKRERSAEDAETQFNQLSLQERGKFQKETLVNVGGRVQRNASNKQYASGDKELIVVTILLAADGGFKLPKVDSRASLKEALSMLGAVRVDDLLAVEVLWTPEEEGDYFTVEDLAYDYPTLITL